MVFSDGTQSKQWIFTKEELFEMRANANKKCIKQLKLYDNNIDLSLCISEVEELKVVDSFLAMIRHFYRKFVPILPQQVYGVSVTYFRRFFLKYSVMDFHPREIIVACIYVACKVAEFSISMDTFLKNIPKNSEKYHSFIYNSELFLIDELNYDLWIYTPYEPFKGFMIELRAYEIELLSELALADRDNNGQILRDNIKAGISIMNDWYETDLMMMFSPDHIALAAVEACSGTSQTVLKDFIKLYVARNDESIFTHICSDLEKIKAFIHHELVVVGVESLKVFEHRIDACRNPKYNVLSNVYQEFKQKYDEKYSSFD